MSEAELEHMMRSTYEDDVRRYAPIRRAIGILFRAIREERKLTRLQLVDQSNVPAREIGRIERGASDFCLGDMMRLCIVLKYPLETLIADVRASVGDLNPYALRLPLISASTRSCGDVVPRVYGKKVDRISHSLFLLI